MPIMYDGGGNSQRLSYIDVIKGIGILLVILQHCLGGGTLGSTPGLQKTIASFHMPLFFFISGFLYKKKTYKDYLFSRMTGLVIPYGIVSIINWILLNVCIVLKKVMSIENLFQILKFEGYWFILCLIYISIVFYFIDYYVNKKLQMILGTMCLICGLIYCSIVSRSSNTIVTSLVGLYFYMVGVFSRSISLRVNSVNKRIMVGLFGVFILILIYLISNLNTLVTVARNEYGNPVLFVLCSLLGILALFLLGLGISTNRILEFYGKNTLIILTTQFPIYRATMFLINRTINYGCVNVWISFIISVLAEAFVVMLVNKFFPLFAGKTPNIMMS